MGKLYYFQAPNFDINPDSDVAPRLGSIFSNLEMLKAPLNQQELITIPKNLMNQSVTADFNENDIRGFQTQADLNANGIQGIGFGGSTDLIYAFARDKKNVYHCELLETLEFEPNQDFVTESIRASWRVQSFLENSLVGRKRVYMITGLKIASGFSKSTNENHHSAKLRVAAKATVLGGLGLNINASSARTVSQGRTLNRIVFAYRAIRIKLKRDGEARYRYRSGGKYGIEDDDDDDGDGDDEDGWDLQPLEEEDRLKDFPDSVEIDIEGALADE
ncbi:uncharacterized protein TrAtP1_010097 [Trichoderma atroviride]|uniref:Uncharacterized protein n=1 Tax=Hypocrea atroviridis (strain ATCC 20476 / IMI 206040) TaxID=452589 RepID=G9NQA1_HYPAI|nr:uncharacterized protein TRIATDRAFT_81427 [Trichoderma atroviride IMI 206040]EHK47246.1 hypothetical protein TRIATDRAFT_81427 [Trichoderma atroviride IMI 206040]UKZ69084.1 hypothetical protein TrAtP1_010097 [Trichoderma atroviride]